MKDRSQIRKRPKTEGDENPDRWVISYADFITLLFAFFTTMYAISRVDRGKLEMFEGSMKTALKSETPPLSRQVIEGIAPVPPEITEIEGGVRSAISDLPSRQEISVRPDERGLVISLGAGALFDFGQAEIREDAEQTLAAMASVIRGIPNHVLVEGHTDNIPIRGSGLKYASNWELSAARATGVLVCLIKKYNLPPQRLSAAGYAEFRPAASNETPEGRAKNRRVDIVILRAK